MNKQIGIVIGIIALVLVFTGVYALMGDNREMETKEMMEKQGMEVEKMNQETMMNDEVTEKSNVMKVGSYEAYSADKIMRADTGDVVLFFHASWCPSCRGLNASIESNLASIPSGVTILKTNYDTETELKKKYGVTYQHTLVQVDKEGNLIKKWSGGQSLDALLSQIQ